MRLLEYILKLHHRLPNKEEYLLPLLLVDLYSYHSVKKMAEIGSIFVGLLELSSFYRIPSQEKGSKKTINRVMKAIELVDQESYQLLKMEDEDIIEGCFIQYQSSLGSVYLPFDACSFLIDQLLLRQPNPFDICIHFAILIMVISDEFQ